MVEVENLADWRGRELVDRDGESIGKLEEVYVDTETEQPMFGSVKEGFFGKHLTFVPLQGATASPDGLTLSVTKKQVKDAPNIDQEGELDKQGEGELYRHYGIHYVPALTPSGRRLAKR